MKRFIYLGTMYQVHEALGVRGTDKEFDVFKGKKVGGRKTITVKINRYNGQAFEV